MRVNDFLSGARQAARIEITNDAGRHEKKHDRGEAKAEVETRTTGESAARFGVAHSREIPCISRDRPLPAVGKPLRRYAAEKCR